jgi:preprotein translocase subunit SecD
MIQNEDIENAESKYYRDNVAGIHIRLNQAGSRKWADMTIRNKGRYIAIIVDGIVLTSPMVYDAVFDGNMIISGKFSMEEARELADGLSAGAYAQNLNLLREEISSSRRGSGMSLLLLLPLSFILSAGLSLILFNTLKNK